MAQHATQYIPGVWQGRNPFTDEYLQEEVDFCAFEPHEGETVSLVYRAPTGRMDDYLNAAFWDGTLKVPCMYINNKLWMSLTRMEVQSQYLPILWARGHVATIGLGLGHFTLRAMEKPSVETVTVYERNMEVIELFRERFANRDGFSKVQFVWGDALATCVGQTYDFMYVDKYKTLCGDDTITDLRALTYMNQLTEGMDSYHFWGMEKVFIEAVLQNIVHPLDIPLKRSFTLLNYLKKWMETPIAGMGPGPDGMPPTLQDMYRPSLDEDYIRRVLDCFPGY